MVMALTVTTATRAEDVNSANYLLPGCKEWLARTIDPNSFRRGLCVGTVETIAFMAPALKARCADIPKGVTNDQSVQVVIRYIEARANRMHESFRFLALEAIVDAWPCRGGTNGR